MAIYVRQLKQWEARKLQQQLRRPKSPTATMRSAIILASAQGFGVPAIASALVFHQHKISHHSYEKLDKAFTQLERKPWVWPELKDLLAKARAICQQHEKVTG
jgi:hypothetical protein